MSAAPLRSDLDTIQVDSGKRPYRIVVDEISGRFSRVSEYVWQQLSSGQADGQLLAEATEAGWTRTRERAAPSRFSLLALRIPFGGLDWLARLLAAPSAVIFAPKAILFFACVITIATLTAISRSVEMIHSLGSLSAFLAQTNPITISLLFVTTKVVHELGHAVMCRRMGSRCGEVGVMLFCGMPCPYCDVTDIWRQSSSIKRMAVMLAGIYVELLIASAAVFTWVYAIDPTIRFMALNLIIVCGVSTILFNANPLMRYDGYYVLADMLGSPNLRKEAQAAFRGVVTRRIAGESYNAKQKNDHRSLALAGYHAAAKIYRVGISCAIAAFVIGIAAAFEMRGVGVAVVLIVAAMMLMKNIRRTISVACGEQRWRAVPIWRRSVTCGLFVLFVGTLLFLPLPRYRQSSGMVDCADAVSVYLPSESVIESVSTEFGDQVDEGEELVRVRSDQKRLDEIRLQGQLSVAKLRSQLSKKNALDGSGRNQNGPDHWRTLRAAEDSIQIQLASTQKQIDRCQVRATVGGMVIPGKPSLAGDDTPARLRDQQGLIGDTRGAWCRISQTGRLYAALVIDARDRPHIRIGSHVRISLDCAPSFVVESEVVSVSEIQRDERVVDRQSAYQVLCEIPAVPDRDVLFMIGQQCHGVFPLPRRSFASDFATWFGDWIRE